MCYNSAFDLLCSELVLMLVFYRSHGEPHIQGIVELILIQIKHLAE